MPLAFTFPQIQTLKEHARPLPEADRQRFIKSVGNHLLSWDREVTVSDTELNKAIRFIMGERGISLPPSQPSGRDKPKTPWAEGVFNDQ